MKTSWSLLPVLVLCSAVCIFSCSTTGKIESPESIERTITPFPPDNRLILFETGISLPPGWTFWLPEEEELLLTFTDPEGLYQGFLEWCSVGYSLTDTELLTYFTNDVQGITINRTSMAGGFLLFECTADTDPGAFFVALIPKGLGFFILELRELKPAGIDAADICAGIAAGITFEPASICRRTVAGLYDFHSYNSVWNWAGDTSRGGIFYGFLPGWKLCTVSVAVTEENMLETHLPEEKDYSFFTETVPVNNREVEAQAAGRNLENGGEVYFLLKGDLNYLLHLAYRDDEKSILYNEVLGLDEIRQLFLAGLTFDGLKQ